MKPFIILLFSLCVICAESHSQSFGPDSAAASTRDSISILRQIGKTSAVVAITTVKVGGQCTLGLAGGAIGAACLHFNPVTAGIGFIIGSSCCVYLIGDIGNGGRGQYQWVLTAGAINGVIYLPVFLNNQHMGIGAIGLIGLAMVTTVASEIITFYATQKESDPTVGIGMTLLPSQKDHSYIPAVNVGLHF